MEDKFPMNPIGQSEPKGKIVALYSDIGRGHPSYLDSLLYLLKKKYPSLITRTVFEESKGLSLLSWRFIKWMYNSSGKGGLHTRFYNFIRTRSQKGSQDSLATKLLGRDLKKAYAGFEGICLVDHPLIARSLADICRVWYVHGEIAAPAECAIKGVEKILVPLEETKEKLVVQGAEAEAVVVCGLMIEPQLVQDAKVVFKKRLDRIKSDQPLTVGFFTSGAYPKEHMEKIVLGAESVIREKYKAIIFCGTNPQKYEWVKNRAQNWGAKIVEDREEESPKSDDFDLMLVSRKTRQDDTQRAVELIPHLDAFVAASHERTNWTVGLGLPMMVLFPLIGTFASQNFEFAQKQGVVYPVDSIGKAENLGQPLTELRQSGKLLQMAENGFGMRTINGMDTAVSCLAREIDLTT
jgi:hypothetical protein